MELAPVGLEQFRFIIEIDWRSPGRWNTSLSGDIFPFPNPPNRIAVVMILLWVLSLRMIFNACIGTRRRCAASKYKAWMKPSKEHFFLDH